MEEYCARDAESHPWVVAHKSLKFIEQKGGFMTGLLLLSKPSKRRHKILD